ncbi:MAG: Mpv17/PMP22 family protein [archaeon]|nr:Mpv17/PMP22 family protein [archaeon]
MSQRAGLLNASSSLTRLVPRKLSGPSPLLLHQARRFAHNKSPTSNWNLLRNSFKTHPYAANVTAAFVLWTLGDILSQVVEKVNEIHVEGHPEEKTGLEQEARHPEAGLPAAHPAHHEHDRRPTIFNPLEDFDLSRTVRMALYGLCVGGPLYCWWYQHLTKLVPMFQGPPRIALLKMAVVKTFFDQFVFCPPELAFFFTLTTLMEGGWWEDVKQRLVQDYVATFYVDIVVWVPIQMVNFMFIPPSFQAVFVHCGNLGWNAYLRFVQSFFFLFLLTFVPHFIHFLSIFIFSSHVKHSRIEDEYQN